MAKHDIVDSIAELFDRNEDTLNNEIYDKILQVITELDNIQIIRERISLEDNLEEIRRNLKNNRILRNDELTAKFSDIENEYFSFINIGINKELENLKVISKKTGLI